MRGRGERSQGVFHPVDVHVGLRLRIRRKDMSLSQEKLGQFTDLTFQQIQKYERGANRIAASRLYELAKILKVPISYFFEDMPTNIANQPPTGEGGFAEDTPSYEQEILSSRESLDLLRAYYAIESRPVRKRFLDLLRSFAISKETPSSRIDLETLDLDQNNT